MIDITRYEYDILIGNTYDIVFNQYYKMLLSLLVVVIYNIALIFLVKYDKIDYKQYYIYSYYGFVANMCIVFMMIGSIL